MGNLLCLSCKLPFKLNGVSLVRCIISDTEAASYMQSRGISKERIQRLQLPVFLCVCFVAPCNMFASIFPSWTFWCYLFNPALLEQRQIKAQKRTGDNTTGGTQSARTVLTTFYGYEKKMAEGEVQSVHWAHWYCSQVGKPCLNDASHFKQWSILLNTTLLLTLYSIYALYIIGKSKVGIFLGIFTPFVWDYFLGSVRE